MPGTQQTTTKQPLPWWADPRSTRNVWSGDYSRTYNPQGFTDSTDPNYRYQTWLQQNFDTSQFVNGLPGTQTQYGGESGGPQYTQPAPSPLSSQVPMSTAVSSATAQIPATTQAAEQARMSTSYGNSNPSPTAPPSGDRLDGFAGRYTPAALRDMLLNDPAPIVHDWAGQDGRANYINLEGDMKRYADVAPRLYELLTKGNMSGQTQSDDAVANWMVELLNNQSTVGGRSPMAGTILDSLYAAFNNKDSTLGAKLYADGTPVGTDQQIAEVMRYLPIVGEFSNPSYANAVYQRAQRLAQEYRGKIAKGQADGQTFVQFLQDNMDI